MSTRRRFVQQFRTVLANLTFYPVETDVHLLAPEEEPQPLERTSENAETDLQAFVECCSKLVRIVPHFESIMSSMFARFSMFDAEIVQEALDGFLPYLARHPEIIAFDDRMAMVLRHRIIDRLRRRRACRNREVHAIQNCAEYHFHDKMLQERIRYVQELDRIMGTLRPFENPIHCQMILLHASKLNNSEIGEVLGRNRSTILRWQRTLLPMLYRLPTALDQLTPDCREIVDLRLRGELSRRDICQLLGITDSECRRRLAVARWHIRQWINT